MELKEILKGQRDYFNTGSTRDLACRRKALLWLWDSLQRHEKELLAALWEDLGKSEYEAYATEIAMVYSELRYMLRHLRSLAKPRRVHTPAANFPAKSMIYREPYGVVLIMSPWNYPVQLTLVPLIGALACGNCAVVKPSKDSPAVSRVMARILKETFSQNYVYTVLGGREENQKLLAEKFDYIFFTGGKEPY